MEEKTNEDEDVTEDSEDGMDSDDPLTATDTKYGKSFRYVCYYNYNIKFYLCVPESNIRN
jgi:hypothetical protein